MWQVQLLCELPFDGRAGALPPLLLCMYYRFTAPACTTNSMNQISCTLNVRISGANNINQVRWMHIGCSESLMLIDHIGVSPSLCFTKWKGVYCRPCFNGETDYQYYLKEMLAPFDFSSKKVAKLNSGRESEHIAQKVEVSFGRSARPSGSPGSSAPTTVTSSLLRSSSS